MTSHTASAVSSFLPTLTPADGAAASAAGAPDDVTTMVTLTDVAPTAEDGAGASDTFLSQSQRRVLDGRHRIPRSMKHSGNAFRERQYGIPALKY